MAYVVALVAVALAAYFFAATYTSSALSWGFKTVEEDIIAAIFGILAGVAYWYAWQVVLEKIPRGTLSKLWRALR